MSGQNNLDFSSQSGGPHPTIAGNVLDPAVSADAQKGGRGVGGTSESTIKDEAREHIGGGSSGYGHGSTGTGQGYGSSQGQGFDTGSSVGRSDFNEPSATRQHDQGIDHIKTATGLDNQAGRATGLDQNSGVASGVSTGATGVGHSETGAGYGTSGTTGTGTDYESGGRHGHRHEGEAAGAGALGGAGAAAYGADGADSRGHLDAAGNNNSSISPSNRGTDATSGSSLGNTSSTSGYDNTNPTSSSSAGLGRDAATRDSTTAADTTSASSQAQQGTAASGDDVADSTGATNTSSSTRNTGSNAGAGAGAGATSDDSRSGPPPNIPTAGGERIGTKHWGESKVIPDNPPRRPSETGGTSSSAGQPDDLTKSNTNKNTGGATHPGSKDETGKESVIDKIKDKLHMGHK